MTVVSSAEVLREAFWASLSAQAREAFVGVERLGEQLVDGVARARAEHPSLALDDVEFVRRLAGVLSEAEPAEGSLDPLRMGDLYLAHGCLLQEPKALASFERAFGADIDRIAGAGGPGEDVEDLRQSVRTKLLVRSDSGRPKLAGYRGTGALMGWVRVIASRAVVDVHRRRARGGVEVPVEPAMLADLHEAHDDPELAHMAERYRHEVHQAFERAFEALSERERHLLRHQLVHRLGYDELGALYGVHRTTASRWVEAARARLVESARAELMHALGAGEATVDSVVALVRSQLELSVHRLLQSTG